MSGGGDLKNEKTTSAGFAALRYSPLTGLHLSSTIEMVKTRALDELRI
jgi:hypothetical protein